jgi:hypothetical protein
VDLKKIKKLRNFLRDFFLAKKKIKISELSFFSKNEIIFLAKKKIKISGG